MLALLRRLHLALRARLVRHYRIGEVERVFRASHIAELKQTPINMWPQVQARQTLEIEKIRAGSLDIIDRKSWAYPFLPSSVQRLSMPVSKNSPYNLRRFSRTPVARRAINLIKNAVIQQPWEIVAIDGVDPADGQEDQKERIKIAKGVFQHPNNTDSHQTWIEMGIEDMCILGAFVAELEYTMDPERPIKSWIVNVESIRIFVSWSESTPDLPHYAQMTGLQGERGAILFYDDELMYLKDNPGSDNPFGLGKLEVAFTEMNSLLGVQRMAGMAGSDQVHKCFPGSTEVLTRRGWIRWDAVRDDEEFATRGLDGQFQWQTALGFVRERHTGDMIRFNNRGLNITVTPNHRMYGHKVRKDWKRNRKVVEPVGFVEAVDLFDDATNRPGKGWQSVKNPGALSLADFRIPTTSVWQDGALPSAVCKIGSRRFDWNDWAAFLGIWIAEGSCIPHGMRSDYRVQIAQSKQANPDKYKKIKALLTRMGFDFQAKDDRFIFVDHGVWEVLRTMGDSYSKAVPQWIKDAPVEIIQTFFDWAMLGDGTVRGKKRTYYTASSVLAGDMQELFQKLGSSAAVLAYLDGHSQMYRVEEMLRDSISIIPAVGRGQARMPVRVPYDDMVYCAMVPNGTLYCRENGYAFWSGNTWLWWEQPQTDAAYQIVRRHIQNELEGQAKISIMGGMKKPDVIEVQPTSIDDLLIPWQEMCIRMVANAFDMSAMTLGVEHDVNRAVGTVLADSDFRSAVVPMAKRLMEGFTRKILHEKLGWYDLAFVYQNLDDPDLETKTDMCSRMYSANALTPNEFRKKVGMEPLDTPLADLTQFEAMLLNLEAMSDMQDRNATNAMGRQQDAQQQQFQQQQEWLKSQPKALGNGQPGQGGPGGAPNPQSSLTPGNVARGGQPQSPKPLALPKFPIASSRWTAKELAIMPVNQLADRIDGGQLPPARKLLRDMRAQEPGILDQMSDEVRQFFEDQMEKETQEQQKKPGLSKKTLEEWTKNLRQKARKSNKRITDMTEYLQETGRYVGKPGVGPKPYRMMPQPGKPGKPPAPRGI